MDGNFPTLIRFKYDLDTITTLLCCLVCSGGWGAFIKYISSYNLLIVMTTEHIPKTAPVNKRSSFGRWFNYFSNLVTSSTGKPAAFITAFLVIIVWALTGPIFHFSDTWQLVINTGTTVVTFLMVFVIQQSQNKDTLAIHLKLNELIAANKSASNRLVNIEDLTPEELGTLKEFYRSLSILSLQDKNVFTSHSIDEAKHNHKQKMIKQDVKS